MNHSLKKFEVQYNMTELEVTFRNSLDKYYKTDDLESLFIAGQSAIFIGGRYDKIGRDLLTECYELTSNNDLRFRIYQQLDTFGHRLYQNQYLPEKFSSLINQTEKRLKDVSNYSQCMQDVFVLSAADQYKNSHSYLEFGASSPVIVSNTYLLEQLGWIGLSYEFDLLMYKEFKLERKNPILYGNVFDHEIESDIKEYHIADADGFIDYVQFDIDPTEDTLNLLPMFLGTGYKAGIITFEHNKYLDGDKYKNDAKILLNKDYDLVVENISPTPDMPFEDWYIHKDYKSNWVQKSIGAESRCVNDVFYRINTYI